MDVLLGEFKIYFVEKGKYPSTVQKYEKELRRFFRERHIREIADITEDCLNNWVYYLRTRKLSNGYIANSLWAIKAFLRFIKERKKLDCYEWDHKAVEIPRVTGPDTVEYLEWEDLNTLFQYIDIEDIHQLRLRTLIETMIHTGMRPTEALVRKIEEIRGQHKIKIIGKGGKERSIRIHDRVHYWVEKYLSRRTDYCEYLFVTHCKEKNWELRSAEEAFLKAVRRSGLNQGGRKIVLHTLRHTFGTHMALNGCLIDHVQRMYGHSKIETTRKYYIAVQEKHTDAAYEKYLNFDKPPALEV